MKKIWIFILCLLSIQTTIKVQGQNHVAFGEAVWYYEHQNYYNALYYANLSISQGYSGEEVKKLLQVASRKYLDEVIRDHDQARYGYLVYRYQFLMDQMHVEDKFKKEAMQQIQRYYYGLADWFYQVYNLYNATYYAQEVLRYGDHSEARILLNQSANQLYDQSEQFIENKQLQYASPYLLLLEKMPDIEVSLQQKVKGRLFFVQNKEWNRSMWLWNTPLIQTEEDQIFSFSVEEGVNQIYLQVNQTLPYSAYQSFIQKATEKGIRVYALDGAPSWTLQEKRPTVDAFLYWVKQYNEASTGDSQFKGVHVDMEPYLLSQWESDPNQVVEDWMNISQYIVGKSHQMGLNAGADIPFWLDNLSIQKDGFDFLHEWMQYTYDSITLMDYRDHATGADGILYHAQKELDFSQRIQKPMYIGLETLPSSEGEKITFYEEGKTILKQELSLVDQATFDNPYFHGIAIHDYKGWKTLKE